MKAESPREEDCRMTCGLNSQVGLYHLDRCFHTWNDYLYLIRFNSFGIIYKLAR